MHLSIQLENNDNLRVIRKRRLAGGSEAESQHSDRGRRNGIPPYELGNDIEITIKPRRPGRKLGRIVVEAA